jgi:hypothetical protein
VPVGQNTPNPIQTAAGSGDIEVINVTDGGSGYDTANGAITVTITGDTTGTWVGATNGIGLYVNFSLGAGSTRLGTAGAWAAAGYYGATGQVNLVSTSGATFYITGVQLEKGSTATSFDYRPYGTELQLCQRYYEVVNWQHDYNSASTGAVQFLITSCYVQPKRATPTVTIVGTPSYYQCSALTATASGNYLEVAATASNAGSSLFRVTSTHTITLAIEL